MRFKHMIKLHAQSYSVSPSASFQFSTLEEYTTHTASLYASHGLEEFILEFIDGTDFESSLASTINLAQHNVAEYFELLEQLEDASDTEQVAFLYLMSDIGYDTETALEKYEYVELSDESATDLAYAYAEDVIGLTGFALQYFNAESFANDCMCGGEWSEVNINGSQYIVTNVSGF
jgi:hypothetical protein